MQSRFRGKFQALIAAVLEGRGDSAPSLRHAAARRAAQLAGLGKGEVDAGAALPDALRAYVDKVALHAYKVLDRDVEHLLEESYTQDAVFELTISTALGAARARLARGLELLNREEGKCD